MEKKMFLIVSSDPKKRQFLETMVIQHFSPAKIYTASNGSEALAKIKNATPAIVITDLQLPRISGAQFIDIILKDPKLEQVSILISEPPPKAEKYMDEVVVGKVQYLVSKEEKEFLHCVNKGLNYSNAGKAPDFISKFISEGEILMREGDQADCVYILRRGRLVAYQMVQGKKVILGYVEPGEFVGEMAYISGERRSATVEATALSELIEIPLGTFEAILYKRPAWAKKLVHILSKRLKNANSGLIR